MPVHTHYGQTYLVRIPLGGYFFRGESSTQSLPAVLAMVVAEGNDVHKLNVHRPDLGDVFLHLTGKGLRD